MVSETLDFSWVESIDAVYKLFEDDALKSKYPSLSEKVEKAVRLCETVIQELGLERCALSFNGGKDCTVIVHILAAVLRRLASQQSDAIPSTSQPSASQPLVSLPSVYITCPSPFPILEAFVRSSQRRYRLDLYTVAGAMKEGLIEYFDGGGEAGVPEVNAREQAEAEMKDRSRTQPGRPKRNIQAIFVGIRDTDPGGDTLEPRKWTDPSWPPVERIHPILDWDYRDVWSFLRCTDLGEKGAGQRSDGTQAPETGTAGGGPEGVPYCILYDQGFTSLGSTFNTFPNPILRREDGSFRPAWQLEDGASERAGRGDKK